MTVSDESVLATRLPRPENSSAKCRRCGEFSSFRVEGTTYVRQGLLPTVGVSERILVCTCDSCKKRTVILEVSTGKKNMVADVDANWDSRWALPSAEAQVPPYAPSDVGDLYREASVCLGADCFRASAVMTRAALDAALIGNGADKKDNLDGKIQKMKGKLRQQLIDIAGNLRLGGNHAAHRFGETWSREEAEELFAFLGEVLKELYETPQRLANLGRMRSKRASGTSKP